MYKIDITSVDSKLLTPNPIRHVISDKYKMKILGTLLVFNIETRGSYRRDKISQTSSVNPKPLSIILRFKFRR